LAHHNAFRRDQEHPHPLLLEERQNTAPLLVGSTPSDDYCCTGFGEALTFQLRQPCSSVAVKT
jgi:hypothetical protein